ncbi:MAG TPA: T9SS type A sorting domain-containing protein [Bacteroidia bacterium]|nr:T9SS type A sorting domain-containing protein [Bacteroidia bacterium]HMU19983.1 T9SS type A sorting domain-containing protein [Bacteroidia bacterium]
MIKFRLGLLYFVCAWQLAYAQKTPRANAVPLADSLVFNYASSVTHATLTYNPIAKKYYSLRIGNATFPLQTWDLTGGLPIYMDTAGLDSRGIWWNPNTNQVERNCFSTLGWTAINLDASKNALSTYNILFTGAHQPNAQSVGAYDYKTNAVIFYENSNMYVYDRNTATLLSTIPLTGITLTGIANTYSIIYTGQTNYEVGLLDYVNKRVLLYNRATGVLTGTSQLPSTAITHNQFRFCYANERVWLFNSTLKKWNSFYIWNEPLPIELVSFTAQLVEQSKIVCKWTTATEVNNNYFEVEKSRNGVNFLPIGKIAGAGNSNTVLNYSFTDEQPFSGINYYRLKQTDYDGAFSYSKIVTISNDDREDWYVFPNPVTDIFFIKPVHLNDDDEVWVDIYSSCGKRVMHRTIRSETELRRENLSSGIYQYIIYSGDKIVHSGKFILH